MQAYDSEAIQAEAEEIFGRKYMQHVFAWRKLLLRKAIVEAQRLARQNMPMNEGKYAWNSGYYYSYIHAYEATTQSMSRKLP